MNCAVGESPAALEELRPSWQALFDRCPEAPIFLSWEWASRWWAHFAKGHQPHLLTLSEGDELVAIAPLMLIPDSPGGTIAFIGSEATTDYADLLALPGREREAAATVLQYLARQCAAGYAVALEPLADDSPLLQSASALTLETPVVTRRLEPCPRLDLPPMWEGYLASLSRSDRHELRRKMRRAESAGQLALRSAIDPEEVERALPDFYRLHQASSDPRKARFLQPEMQGFFTHMALALAQRGWLRLASLELNGTFIASALSFRRGRTVALYNSGFDPAYGALSPGIVLVALEVQAAIQDGCTSYDFLRGAERYKYDLGARDRFVYRLCFRGSPAPQCVSEGAGTSPEVRR